MNRILQGFLELGLLLVLAEFLHGAPAPRIQVSANATKTIDVAGLSAEDLAAITELALKA
ncbi:MAG TPA: hypothetical protein VGZ25_08360 [Gemmataceae bacterium]|nr:hypothetical protein [Gemmataceae bacterium]